MSETSQPWTAQVFLLVPVVKDQKCIWEDEPELLSPNLVEEIQSLQRETLWKAIHQHRAYDSLYQFLRFILQAVRHVYRDFQEVTVDMEYENQRTDRLGVRIAGEAIAKEIRFEFGNGDAVDEEEDQGLKPIRVLPSEEEEEEEEKVKKRPRENSASLGLQVESEWNQQFTKLQAFRKTFGHFHAIETVDNVLQEWVQTQRYLYEMNELTMGQIQQLKNIGFDLDAAEDVTTTYPETSTWESNYQKLHYYHSLHGHCNVPPHFNNDPHLSNWVLTQRRDYHQCKLSRLQIDQLSQLHFVFGLGQDDQWDQYYAQLVSSPSNDDDPKLREWLQQQRALQQSNQLSPEAAQLLNEIIGPVVDEPQRKVARTSIATPPITTTPARNPRLTELLQDKITLQEDTVELQQEQVELLKEKLELHQQKVQLQKEIRHLVEMQQWRDKIAAQEKELQQQQETLKEQDEKIQLLLWQIQEKKSKEVEVMVTL